MNSIENTHDARELHFKLHKASAIITGISLLLMAIIAGIAYGSLHAQIIVRGDVNATAQLVIQKSYIGHLEKLKRNMIK